MVVQRAAAQDLVAGERDQERMLDVVIERIAVADAFEREAGRGRNDLRQRRVRRTETTPHVGAEKLLQ